MHALLAALAPAPAPAPPPTGDGDGDGDSGGAGVAAAAGRGGGIRCFVDPRAPWAKECSYDPDALVVTWRWPDATAAAAAVAAANGAPPLLNLEVLIDGLGPATAGAAGPHVPVTVRATVRSDRQGGAAAAGAGATAVVAVLEGLPEPFELEGSDNVTTFDCTFLS